MPEPEVPAAQDSAEKAYAAAAEAIPPKSEPAVAPPDQEKPITMAAEAAKIAEPAKPAKQAIPTRVKRTTKTTKAVAPTVKAKPGAPRGRPPKVAAVPAPSAPAAKTKTKTKLKAGPVLAKAAAAKRKPKIKTGPTASPMKETIMDKSSKITDGIKTAVAEAQEKAKAAYAKGAAAFGEYTDFTKGNVEAMVESGKILASGVQKMGVSLVSDTKETADGIASELKGFAGAKTPAELLQMQSEMMHRQFDKAVAYNSKASEAMLKLLNDAMAPVAGRLSLTMDKLRKAA